MLKHFLIPVDGSALSQKAVLLGMRLARDLKAKVTVIHVIPLFHKSTSRSQALLSYHVALPDASEASYVAQTGICADKILHVASRVALRMKVACETIRVRDDQPYRSIIHAAESKGCDIIVMASHGRSGLRALILGNETQKVLVQSHIPVLVCR